jgi:hypothetical protein
MTCMNEAATDRDVMELITVAPLLLHAPLLPDMCFYIAAVKWAGEHVVRC